MSDPAARARVAAWMEQTCSHGLIVRLSEGDYFANQHECPDCLLAFAAAQRDLQTEEAYEEGRRVGERVGRAEEREATADWYRETFCPRSGVEGDEKHARGDCEPCNLAHAIRARREGPGGEL